MNAAARDGGLSRALLALGRRGAAAVRRRRGDETFNTDCQPRHSEYRKQPKASSRRVSGNGMRYRDTLTDFRRPSRPQIGQAYPISSRTQRGYWLIAPGCNLQMADGSIVAATVTNKPSTERNRTTPSHLRLYTCT